MVVKVAAPDRWGRCPRTMTGSVSHIYSTMADKVAAYEAFFNSADTHLVVMGVGSYGVGKSAALNRIEKHGSYVLHVDDKAVVVGARGLTEEDEEPLTLPRVIYHLYHGDVALAEALRDKYGARVLLFARGTE